MADILGSIGIIGAVALVWFIVYKTGFNDGVKAERKERQ